MINDPATPRAAVDPAKALREEIVSASSVYGCNHYSEILIKDCVRSEFAHSNVSAEDVSFFQEVLSKEDI